MSDSSALLRITEIFYSLQGEGLTTGLPTVFVRLTGCPLRCQYCDTKYAYSGGESLAIDDIIETVKSHQTPYVTVTGGEPLAQQDCLILLAQLCDADFKVSLETSGALDISRVDGRVVRVLDIKTPGSGESGRNLLDNLDCLTPADQIKFVICSQADYEWSRDFVREYALIARCAVLFSPSFGQIEAVDLAAWILADHLDVRLQLQLHKTLWGDTPGR